MKFKIIELFDRPHDCIAWLVVEVQTPRGSDIAGWQNSIKFDTRNDALFHVLLHGELVGEESWVHC